MDRQSQPYFPKLFIIKKRFEQQKIVSGNITTALQARYAIIQHREIVQFDTHVP
jgi:hypothetical protein